MRLWSAGLFGLLCVAGASVSAQESKPAPAAATSSTPSPAEKPAGDAGTLAVKANLIVMPVVVHDKKGALVTNLKKEDFSLQIDGQPQTIRYFDHDTDTPLTLGLLVDVSGSMRNQVDQERTASQAFLDTMLAPSNGNRGSDKAFVVQFAKEIELLQDVTDAQPKLQRALNELGTDSAHFHTADDTSSNSSANTDSEGRYIRHGGTALYDAIYLSGDEVMAKQPGKRRAIIVLTDGVDRGSKESLTDAIEAAQRADTIVYGIYYKGEAPHQEYNNRPHRGYGNGGGYPGGGYPGGGYPGGGYPGGGYPGGGYPGGNNPTGQQQPPHGGGDHKPYVDGKHVLERICGETGGRVFEVSKKEPVDDIYKQIAEELRAQYRLAFSPTGDAAKDRYHQISLAFTAEDAKKKLDIQTRDGYYMGQ